VNFIKKMKNNSTILIIFFLLCSSSSIAQSITTDSLTISSFCSQDNVNVSFTATGTFNFGNVFIAQLSDTSGSFSSFYNIGSLSGTVSGTINCIIPYVSTGTSYRIRVIGSDPYIIGSDNGTNLSIYALPSVNFSLSPYEVVTGQDVTFTNNSNGAASCFWDFGNGAIPATFFGCNPPLVQYSTPGVKSTTLTVTSAQGCTDSYTGSWWNSVEVYSCNPVIPSNAIVVDSVLNGTGGGAIVWVWSGGIYYTGGGGSQTIFVETGGTIELNGGGGQEIYLKSGAVLNNTGGGGSHVVIYEPGASIINLTSTLLQCSSLQFDYTNFLCIGVTANITANDSTNFCQGDSVILIANQGISYQWSTGDTTQNVTINQSGNYMVTVLDTNGCSATSPPLTVTVNLLPTANFSYISSGLTVNFTNSSINATSWLWDFGSGDTSFLQNPLYSFPSDGTYNVCLIAENSCGSDTICDSVTVAICPLPVASFVYSDSLLTVQFSDLSVNATNWFWDYGDGDFSTSQNPMHTYSSQGTYNVCLIVYNICGSDTVCSSVMVTACMLPVATFVYYDSLLTVQFSDLSANATNWLWDYGDGNFSPSQNPMHTYSSQGTYNVCLTVTNVCGSNIVCDSINIVFTSITNVELENRVIIYPNPNKGIFNMEIENMINDLEISVMNLTGQVIYTKSIVHFKGNLKREIDLTSQSKGIYFLRLRTAESIVIKKKIILTK